MGKKNISMMFPLAHIPGGCRDERPHTSKQTYYECGSFTSVCTNVIIWDEFRKTHTKNKTYFKCTPKWWCLSQILTSPELFPDFQVPSKANLPAGPLWRLQSRSCSYMSGPALSPSPPGCPRRSLARLPGTQCLPVSLLLEVGRSRSRF